MIVPYDMSDSNLNKKIALLPSKIAHSHTN